VVVRENKVLVKLVDLVVVEVEEVHRVDHLAYHKL
jgi:hypothetical protein